MGATYEALLGRLERAAWQRPEQRIGLPAWQKLWLVLRHSWA